MISNHFMEVYIVLSCIRVRRTLRRVTRGQGGGQAELGNTLFVHLPEQQKHIYHMGCSTYVFMACSPPFLPSPLFLFSWDETGTGFLIYASIMFLIALCTYLTGMYIRAAPNTSTTSITLPPPF